MENDLSPHFSVGQFVALTNQTLEYAYPSVEIEGEVASFKISQNKFVFFDLKDEEASIGCFMMVWQLRVQIEDGMKVVITGSPKLTQWGKFSVTIRALRPSGEGSLKKSFELLRAKLEEEGLFSEERKRPLPSLPSRVAVISSTEAAGYADFVKILSDRWGGLEVEVAHVQVQGLQAADRIIQALRYFNAQEVLPEVIVLVRGGGSADDLSCFNDELLVREIAASRIPTLVGVGHEVDMTLADLAADIRASTPSNAAQILVPDRQEVIRHVRGSVASLLPRIDRAVAQKRQETKEQLERAMSTILAHYGVQSERLASLRRWLVELDPRKVLARGYAIVRGKQAVGSVIQVEKSDIVITAEVRHVSKKA